MFLIGFGRKDSITMLKRLPLAVKIGAALIIAQVIGFFVLGLFLNRYLKDHAHDHFQQQVDYLLYHLEISSFSPQNTLLSEDLLPDCRSNLVLLGGVEYAADGSQRHVYRPQEVELLDVALPSVSHSPDISLPHTDSLDGFTYQFYRQHGIPKAVVLIPLRPHLPQSETDTLLVIIDIDKIVHFRYLFFEVYIITAAILLLVTGGALVAFIHQYVKKPLRKADVVLSALGEGNYAFRVREPIAHDEIGQLQRGINAMAERLQASYYDLSSHVSQMEDMQTELIEKEKIVRQLNQNLERRVSERTAELEQANRDLESYAYSISHDLRTPLQIIDGYTDILAIKVKDNQSALRSVDMIHQNIQQMDALIQNVLMISRITREPLKLQSVDTYNIARLVADMETVPFNEHDFDIQYQQLPIIQGDPTMVQQIFHNLISNAVKYSLKRERSQITIGYDSNSTPPRFYVRDNGVGFDSAQSDQVFTIFKRLHSAEEYPGTGVGLAIVKRAVERHGGQVWVESALGEGTTFFFTLSPTK
jgi:signal transduction histidine kinase